MVMKLMRGGEVGMKEEKEGGRRDGGEDRKSGKGRGRRGRWEVGGGR